MTERWQKQVRKLQDVEPERDGWRRAWTRTPSGDGLPPPRQRVVAGVFAFGIFIAVASFGWIALRPHTDRMAGENAPTTEAQLILRIGTEGSDTVPIATLEVDGVTRQAWASGYMWDGESRPFVWSNPPLWGPDNYVAIDLPAILSLTGDADWADARLHEPDSFLVGEADEIGRLDTPRSLDVAPGRYVIEIRGHWRQHGNPSFYFPIEIVDLEEEPSGGLPTLAGTVWRLTALDGQPIDEDADRLWGASIAFKEGEFSGWSGCNSFGGMYRADGSTLSVDGIGGTLVGPCSGQEAWFTRLQAADSWTSDGTTLTVSGRAGSFEASRAGVGPVRHLRVECLPGATQVVDPEVIATNGGVTAILGPSGHAKRVAFVQTSSEGDIESTVGLDDQASTTTVPLAPGVWSVRCAGWGDDIAPTQITVLARDAGSDDDSASNDLRSTYVFSDIEAGPSTAEPQDLAVSFTVAWSGGAYPGVHRCGYRALATDGSVVGELVHLAAWRPGRWYHDVPGDPDAAVRGEVWCEPDRLNDPGIADVEPISIDGDLAVEDLEREYDERLESWAAQFSVGSMSAVRLAGNMWAVDLAWGEADDFTASRQLADRRYYLCVRLPPGHAYRGGEFCE